MMAAMTIRIGMTYISAPGPEEEPDLSAVNTASSGPVHVFPMGENTEGSG